MNISLIQYNVKKLIEKTDIPLEDALDQLEDPSLVSWINICGSLDNASLEIIKNKLGLHELLLEDIVNAGHRSKIDNYKDYLFIIVRILNYNIPLEKIQNYQASFVLGKNYLLSFQETCQDVFNPLREQLRSNHQKIRSSGPDYLCYNLLDIIVDQYFVILEYVDKELETLEATLAKAPAPVTMRKIQRVKREIILLRKAIWPMREVINSFPRIHSDLISEETRVYMFDVYDHTIQVMDTIESFRDIASGLLDVYVSIISQRTNEIMKVLTVVATIFVPLTFVASVYGMNFEHMPELHWRWGYPAVLIFMASVAIGMLIYFRKRKWL